MAGYREGTTGYAAAADTISLSAPTGRVSGDILVAALLSPTDVDKAAPTGWTKYAGPTQTDGSQIWRLNTYTRIADATATDHPDWGANGTASGYGVLSALGCWSGYTTLGADEHDDQDSGVAASITIASHAPGGTYPSSAQVRHVFVWAIANDTNPTVDTKPSGVSLHENTSYSGVSVRRLILGSDLATGSTEGAKTFVATAADANLIQRMSAMYLPTPVDESESVVIPRPPLRRTTVRELPHQVNTAMLMRVKDPETRRALEEVLRAVGANQDHHQGSLREAAKQFALLADDVKSLGDALAGPPPDEGAGA